MIASDAGLVVTENIFIIFFVAPPCLYCGGFEQLNSSAVTFEKHPEDGANANRPPAACEPFDTTRAITQREGDKQRTNSVAVFRSIRVAMLSSC